MWYKRRYFLFVFIVAFSAIVMPTAANAIPSGVGEYMARLASGQLYTYYKDADKPVLPEASAEESVESVEESLLPENAIAVQAFNFSRYEPGETPKLLLANETAFSVDLSKVRTKKPTKKAVLIVHTHGTEAYLSDGADYYIDGDDFRTTDRERNVVAAGDAFAEVLTAAGFEVYHDRTMFDEGSYEQAYTKSRKAMARWLEEKPQIGYIIDIHRDSIESDGGESIKTYCQVGDGSVAQVMLVVGTDEAGATHPDWEDNLSLAVLYQKSLNKHPTFARPVYLRRASYNQQLSSGGLLLEIGSAANTVEEAKAAAVLAAECFVDLFNNE